MVCEERTHGLRAKPPQGAHRETEQAGLGCGWGGPWHCILLLFGMFSCHRGGCNMLSIYGLSERLRMLLFAVYRTLRPVCCVRAPGTRRGTMSMRDFGCFVRVEYPCYLKSRLLGVNLGTSEAAVGVLQIFYSRIVGSARLSSQSCVQAQHVLRHLAHILRRILHPG